MERVLEEIKFTVQGVRNPVPAPIGSEKAGSEVSSARDCNVKRVEHLTQDATSAEKKKMRAIDRLRKLIDELLNFIKEKMNVYGDIIGK